MTRQQRIVFQGRSLEELRSFPKAAMQAAGYQLDRVQCGVSPDDWKPIKAVGKGVREIRLWENSGTFRVIYVARLGDAIYVLRCFQKKTEKTSKADIDAARQRYRELIQELEP